MMNPRPISMRKKVQFLVGLTLLAWATQTLFSQWGLGGLIMPPSTSAESQRAVVTVELSNRVKASHDNITIGDVCRWSDQDSPMMEPFAGIVLMRLSDATGVRPVAISDIRSALRDAGANLISVHFTGAAKCAVTRGDVTPEEIAKALAVIEEPAPAIQQKVGAAARPVVADIPQTPLRDLLVSRLIQQISLPADRVQIEFSPADQATLALTSPNCTFEIDSSNAAGLGDVAWQVIVKTRAAEKRITIAAKARAWEEQLVLTRPLSRGQQIIHSDVISRRELVEKLSRDPVFEREQLVGQNAARDMKAGDVLIAADAAAPVVVNAGQFMTVSMKIGGSTVQTVARAMDSGAKDKVVRAKNEATGQIYQVVITGPDVGRVDPSVQQNVATINPGS
jgi:flagella basal body P-ring formation protein FlgA